MCNFVKPYKKKHKNKYIEGMIYEETGDNLEVIYDESRAYYTYYTYYNNGTLKNEHTFFKPTQTLISQTIFKYDNNNNEIGRFILTDYKTISTRRIFNENNICIRYLYYTYNNITKIKRLIRSVKLKLDDKSNIIFLKDNRIYPKYYYHQYLAKFSGEKIIEYNDQLGNHWNENYGHDCYMPYSVIDKDKIYVNPCTHLCP